MTRILHLSDLHFGHDRPGLAAALAQAVRDARPDLVVITGDLVQRARPAQFARARDWIAGLEAPCLCVPGNHDIPLYDLWRRMTRPFARYRAAVRDTLAPALDLGGVSVVGLSSVDALSWRRGRAWPHRIGRAQARLRASSAQIRIVALHHPLVQPADSPKALMAGAARARAALAQAGANLVLAGHVHRWSLLRDPAPGAGPGAGAGAAMLHLNSGTALSGRAGDVCNDFSVIEAHLPGLSITRWSAAQGQNCYSPQPPQHFVLGSAGWQ